MYESIGKDTEVSHAKYSKYKKLLNSGQKITTFLQIMGTFRKIILYILGCCNTNGHPPVSGGPPPPPGGGGGGVGGGGGAAGGGGLG
jgi:hypothetical protein